MVEIGEWGMVGVTKVIDLPLLSSGILSGSSPRTMDVGSSSWLCLERVEAALVVRCWAASDPSVLEAGFFTE